jgi:WD40 repeat protein
MRAALAFCFILTLATSLYAQPNCPLPPALKPVSADLNIFSEQQESDLGDVVAESFSHEILMVHDDALTNHLTEIGNRLVQYLPPTQFRFHFFLIDLAETNAFSLPGGRVYISRKVVALAHNDDELAGVLAHELGHIVTRHLGVDMTHRLRQVLGVTQVGDRTDIYNKYFQYIDSYRRKLSHDSGMREEHQIIADQVAVFAMARAGYSPQAYADIFDRLEQTHGKTGSWISDLFGTTKPSEKRLREVLKNAASLPVRCAETRPTSDLASFQNWQAKVIAWHGQNGENLPGLVFKQSLALPLRPDIDNLRFSPDGKYVLAQDDGGIHVLSRDPFALLFFIDAPGANKAGFSPDSRSVVFSTRSQRVEVWDVVSHHPASVHEILISEPCLQSKLSPDGKYFACLEPDFTLVMLDAASGETLVSKAAFFEIRNYYMFFLLWGSLFKGHVDLIHMDFSPDGRYFLAGSRSHTLDFDLTTRHEAGLPRSIRNLTQESFAFAGTDHIVSVDPYHAEKSPVLRFPSGEHIGDLPLSNTTHVSSVAHGDYVLLWPLKEAPLGVMNLSTRQLFLSFKHDAGDVYDNWILSERLDGEIAITDLATKNAVASVRLDQSRLGTLEAVATSTDFSRLAMSTATRGATWDVIHNIRVYYSREFTGAWFGDDDSLYADFPKLEPQERSIVKLDPYGNSSTLCTVPKGSAKQIGPYLMLSQPKHENSFLKQDWTVEIRDFRTQNVVWAREFPREVPVIQLQSKSLMLGWSLAGGAGRDELQKFSDLKSKAQSEDFLLEVFDFPKDSLRGKVLVKTNKQSFQILDTVVSGDWVAVRANADRIFVYSLSTGEEKSHVFGDYPAVSSEAAAFSVATVTGEINLYDLPSGNLRREYKFPVSVAYQRFSADGKRLFVLTRDQTAYVLDLTAIN